MAPLSVFSVPRPALGEMCRISQRASREILNGSEVDSDLPDAEGLETLDLHQASVIDYRVIDHFALIVENRDHRLFIIVFFLRYSILSGFALHLCPPAVVWISRESFPASPQSTIDSTFAPSSPPSSPCWGNFCKLQLEEIIFQTRP